MENKKNIIKLLLFTYKKFSNQKYFKKYFFLSIIFSTLNQVFPIIWSYFFAVLLDAIVDVLSKNASYTLLIPQFVAFLCVNIAYILVIQTTEYRESKLSLWVTYWEDNVFSGKKSTLEPQVFENAEFMNDYNTYEWNDWRIIDTLQDAVTILSELIAVGISFFALSQYSLILALFAILSAIPSAVVVKIFGQKIWNIWNAKGEEKIKLSGYRWPFNTTEPANLQEMYVFKYGKYLLGKMREMNESFIGRLNKNTDKRYYWSLGAAILSMIFFVAAIAYSVNLALIGVVSVGILTFVVSAYQQFQSNISTAFYKISSILGNKKLLEIFYNVQTHVSNIPDGEKDFKYRADGIEIKFEDVWFKYPKTEKWILKNINLSVRPDEDLAIVGKNGAGKSTLIKLILRIYDPDKGCILVNGIDLKDLKLEEYHKYVGFLSQIFAKFNISVEENIYMGDVDNHNESDMKKAAEMADLTENISELKYGYKTFLNREVKDGVDLSGGQWQKLAIARAFFRNPKLLILDEPTSAVDALSEEKIFDNIRRNSEDRTTLIVSHRFATVRKAKRIIVIDNGEVVEDGNHESLIKNNGLYSQMYNTQVNKE